VLICVMFNLQRGSMLMPEPYSKLPHSPSGLVRTPTSDCYTTSVEIYVFSVHFVDQFSVFCSQVQLTKDFNVHDKKKLFCFFLSVVHDFWDKGFLGAC